MNVFWIESAWRDAVELWVFFFFWVFSLLAGFIWLATCHFNVWSNIGFLCCVIFNWFFILQNKLVPAGISLGLTLRVFFVIIRILSTQHAPSSLEWSYLVFILRYVRMDGWAVKNDQKCRQECYCKHCHCNQRNDHNLAVGFFLNR